MAERKRARTVVKDPLESEMLPRQDAAGKGTAKGSGESPTLLGWREDVGAHLWQVLGRESWNALNRDGSLPKEVDVREGKEGGSNALNCRRAPSPSTIAGAAADRSSSEMCWKM